MSFPCGNKNSHLKVYASAERETSECHSDEKGEKSIFYYHRVFSQVNRLVY